MTTEAVRVAGIADARRGGRIRSRVKRLGFSPFALVACACLAFWVLSIVALFQFTSEIPDRDSSYQPDFVIDAYYYIHLGDEAIRLAQKDASLSVYEAAESIRPNASTGGVVFMTATLMRVVGWEYLFPLVFGLALFGLIAMLLKSGAATTLVGLPLCGLFPYLGVPSKESFFMLGLLGFAVAVMRQRWLIALLTVPVMYWARPEAMMILAASVLAWAFVRTRTRLVVVAAIGLVVYVVFAREAANTTSLLSQTLSEQADVGFCSVGPINVCVEEAVGNLEWIYFMRLVTLLALPLKWLTDIAGIFTDSTLHGSDLLIRAGLLTHLIWLWRAIARRTQPAGTALALRRILLIFAGMYWCVYGAIIYFQPSRQAIFASVFVGIALAMDQRSASSARRKDRIPDPGASLQ